MRRFGIAALLALAAVWLYAPVRELPFLHFDDGQYVTGNSRVLEGLDWEGCAGRPGPSSRATGIR